jgi:hypothetical protein
MSLPNEYVIEEAVRHLEGVVVYRANHPIHGTVNIYLPDRTLPAASVRAAARRLYQNGLQMREMSVRNVALVTKALEVSQNPNEPYIVTEVLEDDLEELISNGLMVKPKRMFRILSQILQALTNLARAGWPVDRVDSRQIKLPQAHGSEISFNVIEGLDRSIDVGKETAELVDEAPGPEAEEAKVRPAEQVNKAQSQTVEITRASEEAQTRGISAPVPAEHEHSDNAESGDVQSQVRTSRRNIYILAKMCYQLLFGRKYHAGDQVAAANVRKLARRWRRVLDKALSQDVDHCYDTYEAMLEELRKALNRNRRLAIASVPVWLLLALIGSYFAYERYHRYKIMTSPAGHVIKKFLDIVDQTDDRLAELKEPEPTPPAPDDETILQPFDRIEPVSDD